MTQSPILVTSARCGDAFDPLTPGLNINNASAFGCIGSALSPMVESARFEARDSRMLRKENRCRIAIRQFFVMSATMGWTDGYIAVDWGTTNRRAYLIDGTGKHADEFEDGKGILSVAPGDLAMLLPRFGGGLATSHC